MRYAKLYIVVFLLCIAPVMYGQQQPVLTLDLENANMEELVKAIEKQSRYHFYFDEQEMAGLTFNVSARNRTLKDILTQALNGTSLRFAIDDDMNVFITTNRAIQLLAGWDKMNVDSSGSEMLKEDLAAENKVYIIGIKTNRDPVGQATISGTIKDMETGLPLAGATIMADADQQGVKAGTSGRFSITLKKGDHTLLVSADNKTPVKRRIELYGDGNLSFQLRPKAMLLSEVIISARRNNIINRPQMGVERVSLKTIKQIPTALGEADLMKAILTLPGVKSVGEASTGFNVRGGAVDQNLILFNESTIYNPTHFFGFFSAFNPDLVRDVELYKSSIPAKYGGRLSSVLNITRREGDKKKFSGIAGIGLLTGRLNMEGPLVKDKTSFILGGRSTYSNWLLKVLPDKNEFKQSKASFYDINLGVHHKMANNDELQLSGYFSRDHFNLNSDTAFGYTNANFSARWRHQYSKKISGDLIAGFDKYGYDNSSEKNKVNAYKMSFDINQAFFKANMNYYVSRDQTIDFGVNTLLYTLHPGNFDPVGDESLVKQKTIQAERALESAIYASTKYDLDSRLSVEAGLRYSFYNYLGEHNVSYYKNGMPRDESSLVETKNYSSGAFIQTYHGPEIRLSGRYSLRDDLSVKLGFNTLRQYIHMLSNTTAISPTDIWKLSDPNIKPQVGGQLSLGIYKTFSADSLEISIEGYYKKIKNYLDYKSGATLVLNENIERDVLNTKGKAYGVEFLLRKRTGKLSGWLAYTYSRTMLQMNDENQGMIVNRGEWYPSNYDKPHDATLVGNYRVNLRFSVSLNVTYSTGRPITLPIGSYWYGGSERALYSDRNAYRIPDYFRADFSMNIDGNHKVNQLTHNSWTIGVYNLTGRKNPYSVYFTSENGVSKGYKLFIFGAMIPFVNYNIRF